VAEIRYDLPLVTVDHTHFIDDMHNKLLSYT